MLDYRSPQFGTPAWPLILLLACTSGKDPCGPEERRVDEACVPVQTDTDTDTDADADADTDTDSVLDTGPSTPSEVCNDGVDNDLDGLLDCEDGDCAMDPFCVELVCNDGLDSDGDGRTDCEDDDCWGNGCAAVRSNLTSATSATAGVWRSFASQTGSCGGITTSLSYRFGLQGAAGSVRYMPASTPVWTTCTWSVSETAWGNSSYGLIGPTQVNRNGFAVSPGCPLTSSAFLPQYMWFDASLYASTVAIRTRPGGGGAMWASFTRSPSTYSRQPSSGMIPGSPCGSWFYSVASDWSYPNVIVGSSYLQLLP